MKVVLLQRNMGDDLWEDLTVPDGADSCAEVMASLRVVGALGRYRVVAVQDNDQPVLLGFSVRSREDYYVDCEESED